MRHLLSLNGIPIRSALVALVMILAVPAHAAPFCEGDLLDSLERTLVEVRRQYVAVDEAGFDRAAKQLEAAVACLDEPPPGSTVARLHQANALVAFVNGQKGASRRAMIAARLADPTWTLDPSVFPDGHPYRQLWSQATDAGPVKEIGEAPGKDWIVDGVRRAEAPTERAFLLQVSGADGVSYAEYLFDYEDIPDFGQDNSTPAWSTPHKVQLTAAGAGRVLDAEQVAVSAGLRDRTAGAAGGGAVLSLRATPLAFVGFEGVVAAFGGADPVLGGSGGVEFQALALFGAGTPIAEVYQLYGGARVGYARDTVVAWSTSGDQINQTLWPINAIVVGAEGGVRGEPLDLRLTVDSLIGSGNGLTELRGGATGTFGIAGPVAVDLAVSGRGGGITLAAQDGTVVGERRDVELRFAVGPAVWFR